MDAWPQHADAQCHDPSAVARNCFAVRRRRSRALVPAFEIFPKTDPSRTYEYQYTGPAGQALFGLEFRLPTGSVFIEYKFTSSDYWGPLTGRDGSWYPIDMLNQFSRWWKGEEPRMAGQVRA